MSVRARRELGATVNFALRNEERERKKKRGGIEPVDLPGLTSSCRSGSLTVEISTTTSSLRPLALTEMIDAL